MCTFAIAVTPREWLLLSLFLTLNTIINMALIRNTAAMRLRGRVGNTTYYTEGGRQIARVSQNSSNYGETARRTEQQQSQRAKWANLVNFYKASRSWMPKAFENKKRTQSDYNRFMQLNVGTASVYLTKEMYAQGGCVVEPYKITEGSLRSIQVYKDVNVWRTDLQIGQLIVNEDTTVGALSSALIQNNSHLHNGVQITFVSYQQAVTPTEVPQVICTAYELTLDNLSQVKARAFLPSFCLNNVRGTIGTDEAISTGAFAYILSDSTSGKTLVSTQSLVSNNEVLIEQYSSIQAREASIASYGVDSDVFLMSGSYAQRAASATLFVAGVVVHSTGNILAVGSSAELAENVEDPSSGTMEFVMSSEVDPSLVQSASEMSIQYLGTTTLEKIPITITYVSGKRIRVSFTQGSWLSGKLVRVVFTIGGNAIEGSWPYIVEHE